MALTDTIALTTYAIVKADLGLSDDTKQPVVERQILAASEAIQRYCNRDFRKETVTNEKRRPSGLYTLLLNRTPLVSLTSITVNDSSLDMTTVEIEDAGAGVIRRDAIWPKWEPAVRGSIAQDAIAGLGEPWIKVTYIGGYVLPNDTGTRNLPYDLEQACIDMAVSLYRQRGADGRVASEQLGDASVSYGGLNTAIGRGVGGIIPDQVLPILDRYRRLVMA